MELAGQDRAALKRRDIAAPVIGVGGAPTRWCLTQPIGVGEIGVAGSQHAAAAHGFDGVPAKLGNAHGIGVSLDV